MAQDHRKKDGMWIEGLIRDFINLSDQNTIMNAANDRAWALPLVGFSSGADPLYREYKEKYVGDFHWTPLEVFQMTFPESSVDLPTDLSDCYAPDKILDDFMNTTENYRARLDAKTWRESNGNLKLPDLP